MVDIDLLVGQLRERGYEVTDVHPVPENAGTYEMMVDGTVLNLEEARDLLAEDEGTDEPTL